VSSGIDGIHGEGWHLECRPFSCAHGMRATLTVKVLATGTVLLAKWLVELLLSMLQDIALHTPLWYNQFIKITVKEEQYA
jgi:hypothetical protein